MEENNQTSKCQDTPAGVPPSQGQASQEAEALNEGSKESGDTASEEGKDTASSDEEDTSSEEGSKDSAE